MMSSISYQSILITGATGKLGRQLVYECVRKGVRPICLVREESKTDYLDSLNLELRRADLRDRAALTEAVKGVEAVIHAAALVDFRGDRLTQFTGVNVMGALDLFRAAQSAGVKRFVHVSSVAAVGGRLRSSDADGSLCDEDQPFNLGHLRVPYIMTKHAAEKELMAAAERSSTELVVVNPSIMIAPSSTGDDRNRLDDRFKHTFLPAFDNRLNLTDIRDVPPAILTALAKGRPGERYILAGENIAATDLVRMIGEIAGRCFRLVPVPHALIRLAARFTAWRHRVKRRPKLSLYPALIRMLDYDWAYTSEKAARELSYQPRPLRETLTDLFTNNFVGTPQMPE